MKGDYDRLEGTYKLAGLKRLERVAYLTQGIGIIAIFIFLVYIGGAMLNPFYLPLFWASLAALIGIFILSLESIAFRLIEIKKRDSESAKFLMADRSMKKAYTVIVVVLIAFTVAFVPFFAEEIQDMNKMEGQIEFTGEETIEFTSRGRFDHLLADKINLEIIGDVEESVEVYIIQKDTYTPGDSYGPAQRQNVEDTEFDESFEFSMPERDFDEYYIVLQSDEVVEIRYEIHYIMPDHMTRFLSIIFIAFVISHAAWAITLYPIKKRYSDKAIYK